jgi:hypothetical protein
MTSQSKTKDLIQEFVSRKLSVEEELGQKIKQRTLTTYYPTFSKTASEINFEDFKLDYKEESLPHINFDY